MNVNFFRSSTSALSLALILLLTLALTSTWVLSLRGVRLKIGDYYFEKGNFNPGCELVSDATNPIKTIKMTNEDVPPTFRDQINETNQMIVKCQGQTPISCSWTENCVTFLLILQ
jgi:hypothetical protein